MSKVDNSKFFPWRESQWNLLTKMKTYEEVKMEKTPGGTPVDPATKSIQNSLFMRRMVPCIQTSHIWAIRVSAAQQGMLFYPLTLEEGIEIILFLWKRVCFTLGLTLEKVDFSQNPD